MWLNIAVRDTLYTVQQSSMFSNPAMKHIKHFDVKLLLWLMAKLLLEDDYRAVAYW